MKVFLRNLCSCYGLISHILVKREWLQSLWLLGIHRRGKAFVVQALCWWLLKLFHAKWNGNVRISMSVPLWFGSRAHCWDGGSRPPCTRRMQRAGQRGGRRLLYLLLHPGSVGSLRLIYGFSFHKDASKEAEILFNWHETTLYWNQALWHFLIFGCWGSKWKPNSFVSVLKSELSNVGAVFNFICFRGQTEKIKILYP